MNGMDRIMYAIVVSKEPCENTIFNDAWQRECTDEELRRLRQTLASWYCTAFRNNKNKYKLLLAQKNIDKILKERTKK